MSNPNIYQDSSYLHAVLSYGLVSEKAKSQIIYLSLLDLYNMRIFIFIINSDSSARLLWNYNTLNLAMVCIGLLC